MFFFAYYFESSPWKCQRKFSSCQVLFFWFVLLVLGSGLTTSLLFHFLLFLFSFKRDNSGLTGHHTPPARVVWFFLFLFLSPPHLSFRLFWPCVPSVLAFFRGAILGPARFLDSLGTSLRPFLGREAAKAFARFFLWSFVFPFCGVCGFARF